MKKISILLVMILLLTVSLIMTACGNKSTEGSQATDESNTNNTDLLTNEQLNVSEAQIELINRINEDYGSHRVWRYYGNFDECVPVMFAQSEDGVERTVTIAESVIYYGGSNSILIWNDGEFFSVEEAYEQELLTKEEIAIIAEIHNSQKYFELK